MKAFENAASVIVLAPIPPVSLGLAVWWTTVICDWPERDIATATIAATLVGAVVVASMLRRWAVSLFALRPAALGAVALFYSVMIYGVFMGMPLFNLGVGIVGGAVVGHRAARIGCTAEALRRQAHHWALFVTTILLGLCTVTVLLTWGEESLGSELQHMFRLPFAVTRGTIAALIWGGGTALLVVQYLAARAAVRLGAKWWRRTNPILP